MSLRETLRQAFAVDPPGAIEPTPDQQPAVDWFCTQIAKRGLTTPGLIGLEMYKPLNFLSAQAMHFFAPGVWALARQKNYADYQSFAAFLERRGAIDYVLGRIEHFEAQYDGERANPDNDPPTTA